MKVVKNMANLFKDRLREEMELQGIRQTDLAQKTGFSKGRISQWLSGKHEADSEGLCILAKVLNVSESWLMGNDVPKHYEREQLEQKVMACEFLEKYYGADAYELVELFVQLNDLGKSKIMEEVKDMLQLLKYTQSEKREQSSTVKVM